VQHFKAILESKGIHAYVRRPRGRDIFAACGQLAAREGTLSNRIQTTLAGANN
jgi:adenine C2-methylase RlmN of 23S rRNA A2503 and tRNA A37